MSAQREPVLIVGYRSDAGGQAALWYAMWLAASMDAAVHIVHVADLDDYPPDPDGLDWESDAVRHVADVRSEVSSALLNHDGEWTYETVRGDPASALAGIAEDRGASMLVVGVTTDVRGRVLHRALGRSTGRDLLRHARRPVLFVPSEPIR